jgi:hypothetical protein
VVNDFIHTSVSGRSPEDLESWPFDDPDLMGRASAFTFSFAARYAGQMDSFGNGNEVSINFNDHPQDLEAYQAFFHSLRSAIDETQPDLAEGTVNAFHEPPRLVRVEFAQPPIDGDLLAFTDFTTLTTKGYATKLIRAGLGMSSRGWIKPVAKSPSWWWRTAGPRLPR